MNTLLKSGLTLALGLLLCGSAAQAQVAVYAGSPYQGPVAPPNVQYYYIPEIDGYYDLYAQSYLFYDPAYGAWVSSPVLPRPYASYDPRFFHPLAIPYVGRQPWSYLPDHRAYCGRWGVQPGRYYGSRWPGHGYAVAPHSRYGPAYYGHRPAYGTSGHARQHDEDRDNRDGNYGRQSRDDRNDYDNRRGSSSQEGRQDQGRSEQRGNAGSAGNGQPEQHIQNNRGQQPYNGRRGR
ncbi:hypothetical protein [Hymenobacter rubripertinctus]|uniref:DUF3300 domain-containing protein n=1 Tax=Hymenobacter rubripertinctus TaxID=2029981 RepID=A0A418R253_9BACT|nr:hypothetical protein [Hymenobacter rubripertinctus]RIY11517.1 hypothetical protein D0T11_06830 [Hymenobacter rubripertinctus]